MKSLQGCIDELLISGTNDWVDASEVISIAMEYGGARTEDQKRDLAMQLIRYVVNEGLMELGEFIGVAGVGETKYEFRKWDLSAHDALGRVEREWDALGRLLSLGEVFWLQNTDRGDAIGKQLLEQRGRA